MIISKKESFTLCIVTHNRYSELKKCLDSLKDDILKNQDVFLELLIIDNSNIKDFDFKLKKYLNVNIRKLRLKTIYTSSPSLSYARNVALKKAKGNYIIFIDDDALVTKGFIEGYRKLVNNCPDFGIAGGPVDTGEYLKPPWMTTDIEYVLPSVGWPGNSIRPLLPSEWIVGANFIVNKLEAKFFGGFDESLGRNGQIPLNNEEIALLGKFKSVGKSGYWNPHSRVNHPVNESRLTKEYLIRRFAWQAISDMLMEKVKTDYPLDHYLNQTNNDHFFTKEIKNFIDFINNKYTFENFLFFLRNFIKWSLQSGNLLRDNIELDIFDQTTVNISKDFYKDKQRPVAFTDYVGHRILLDAFEINDSVKSYCLPNLWKYKQISKSEFYSQVLDISKKHQVLILGNIDMLLDECPTNELENLILKLQSNCKLYLVIHRLQTIEKLKTLLESSNSFNVISGIITYSDVLKQKIEIFEKHIDVSVLPLPPTDSLPYPEQKSGWNLSKMRHLNFGIFGHLRDEKNIINQIQIFSKISELLNHNNESFQTKLSILGYTSKPMLENIYAEIDKLTSKVKQQVETNLLISDELNENAISQEDQAKFFEKVSFLFHIPNSLNASFSGSLGLVSYLNLGKIVFVSESAQSSLPNVFSKYCNFIPNNVDLAANKIVAQLKNEIEFNFCDVNLFKVFQTSLSEFISNIKRNL